MKAKIYGWHTDIFPTNEEVQDLCKPGAGADSCSWLTMGSTGWVCCYDHKPYSLIKRRESGKMVAMRDGCEKVKNFNPVGRKIYDVVDF